MSHRRRYPPRRLSPRKVARALDNLTLAQVGLGPGALLFIFFISMFPIVGLVIGSYYSNQDHYPTRSLGRTLLAFAIFLHFVYFCVLCPLLMWFALF